jgi:hypothetical protein
LVYVDVKILDGSVHTVEKNTDSLAVASKQAGLEVNADKTKYMVMSRDQNTEQNHNIKTDNKSYERVEQFKFLRTALMNKNFMYEETKSILKSGKACSHSVQNRLYFSLVSKNINSKIHIELQLFLLFC